MELDYNYEVPYDEARARLEALGEYLFNRHGIRVAWSGDKAQFSGKYLVVKIDGQMTLKEGVVEFRGKDPGMLWRKKATGYIKDKLTAYLDPATPLDQLKRA